MSANTNISEEKPLGWTPVEEAPEELLRAGEGLQVGDWLLVRRNEHGQEAGFRVTPNGVSFEGNALFFADAINRVQASEVEHLTKRLLGALRAIEMARAWLREAKDAFNAGEAYSRAMRALEELEAVETE